jgi:2,3-bisphosphoglycerate-independent phosphoglycerate mutase
MILDGWGHGDGSKSDGIAHADTPFVDSLYRDYPCSRLLTDGENVGLPDGQMGNSEVGHLNIGAGRVVYQDLLKINNAIGNGTFDPKNIVKDALKSAREREANVHIMGLLSDGGVHSSQEHLYAICDLVQEAGVENAFIHAFTDGRDTDPHGALEYVKKLQNRVSSSRIKLASIVGRYYAMDRDKRWERVKVACDLLVSGQGDRNTDAIAAIEKSYQNGVTDEFIQPIVLEEKGNVLPRIKEGDTVVCFNFRTDRCREITEMLTQKAFPEHGTTPLDLDYITMTNYNDTFANIKVVYDKNTISNTIGEVLSNLGKKQLRIAETEKYPHVTYFFSGGREDEFPNEKRTMIPSPKVATYNLQPEMSAYLVTDAMVKELKNGNAHFICLNFANPDMVGHTGVYEAITEAVEVIDECVSRVVQEGIKNNYSMLIIADHGNADYITNDDGTPNTAHSKNPVPCILVDDNLQKGQALRDGILADVAPTILELMGIDKPPEMTGNSML